MKKSELKPRIVAMTRLKIRSKLGFTGLVVLILFFLSSRLEILGVAGFWDLTGFVGIFVRVLASGVLTTFMVVEVEGVLFGFAEGLVLTVIDSVAVLEASPEACLVFLFLGFPEFFVMTLILELSELDSGFEAFDVLGFSEFGHLFLCG